jgi:dethiobiotin synthetase
VHRYFVTGTDTGVGKTRVTAAVALALARSGLAPAIVKLVQTGVAAGEAGDAAHAGQLAGVPASELRRYEKPADPWSAALAQGAAPPEAAALAAALDEDETLVAEGSGGLLVPLNANECVGDVAVRAQLRTIVAVGLRLGCLNHALLTLAALEGLGLTCEGLALVECFGPTERGYRNDVLRVLQGKAHVFGILPYDEDASASVRAASELFVSLVRG